MELVWNWFGTGLELVWNWVGPGAHLAAGHPASGPLIVGPAARPPAHPAAGRCDRAGCPHAPHGARAALGAPRPGRSPRATRAVAPPCLGCHLGRSLRVLAARGSALPQESAWTPASIAGNVTPPGGMRRVGPRADAQDCRADLGLGDRYNASRVCPGVHPRPLRTCVRPSSRADKWGAIGAPRGEGILRRLGR